MRLDECSVHDMYGDEHAVTMHSMLLLMSSSLQC